MNLAKLKDKSQIRGYLQAKFPQWKTWHYTKNQRKQKAMTYWVNTPEENRKALEEVYWFVYKESFPLSEAQMAEKKWAAKQQGPGKISVNDWLEDRTQDIANLDLLLKRLDKWDKDQEWQMGEDFFLALQQAVSEVAPGLCDPRNFSTEFDIRRVCEFSGQKEMTAEKMAAEFDFLVGLKQTAGFSFNAYNPRLGEAGVQFLQELKAGLWGNGSFEATRGKTKLSVEMALALAIGAQLDVSGKCTWKAADGGMGLELAGSGQLFIGAQGELSASMSVDLKKGIEMAFKAGGFAGIKGEVKGSAALQYEGSNLVKAEASAYFSLGVGAEFSAEVKSRIFGGTTFSVESGVTLGFGGGTSTSLTVDFSQIYLAGRSEFRKVIYLPTMAKGYKMDLMVSDTKNKHYLKKSIEVLTAQRKELQDMVSSMDKRMTGKKSDEVPLLMNSD